MPLFYVVVGFRLNLVFVYFIPRERCFHCSLTYDDVCRYVEDVTGGSRCSVRAIAERSKVSPLIARCKHVRRLPVTWG